MRLQYNLELTEQEFTKPKYSIPVIQSGNCMNIQYLDKTIAFFNKNLLGYLDDLFIEERYTLPILLKEPLKNSFDACKDIFLENGEFKGLLIINIIANTKRKVITIIIKDNGAGINASDTDTKKKSSEFVGGAGKGLQSIENSFRLEKDYNGATIILRENID